LALSVFNLLYYIIFEKNNNYGITAKVKKQKYIVLQDKKLPLLYGSFCFFIVLLLLYKS